MNPMITRKNVGLYLKQTYNLNEKQLFDNSIVNKEMLDEIVTSIFLEFTVCFYGNNELLARDPFTGQTLTLVATDLSSITSMDMLMESLSDAHKQRMEALSTNREPAKNRIASLSRENQQDKDLEQEK